MHKTGTGEWAHQIIMYRNEFHPLAVAGVNVPLLIGIPAVIFLIVYDKRLEL